MSLFDTAGHYPSQSISRHAGLVSTLMGALKRSRSATVAKPIEDANTLKHRRREEGYLRDIGMDVGF